MRRDDGGASWVTHLVWGWVLGLLCGCAGSAPDAASPPEQPDDSGGPQTTNTAPVEPQIPDAGLEGPPRPVQLPEIPEPARAKRPEPPDSQGTVSRKATSIIPRTASPKIHLEDFPRAPESTPRIPESTPRITEQPLPVLPPRTVTDVPLEAAAEPEPAEPLALRMVDPETGAHLVQVFYATDRQPVDAELSSVSLGIWVLPAAGVAATLALGIATVLLRRRWLLALATVVSLAVTLVLGQSASVRYQKQRRMIESANRQYGADRRQQPAATPLELGVSQVSVPPDHRVGKVESPSVLRLEFVEDAKKHVVLRRVTRREEEDFYRELKAQIDQSPDGQAFVFIHGYNVSFEDAVKRTAQIAYDLRFDGAPICYSWPSHGALAQYTRDQANAMWTATHLESFLCQVAERTGARNLHLVAHSMGNQALVQALERIALGRSDQPPMFGQVIMAAPDVDADELRDRYAPAVTRLARQVTLYASSNDRALMASTKVHGHTRAGLSGPYLTVVSGVETVDVSPIDTSLIGHSYYGNHPLMIRDMQAIVELGEPASGRAWLQRIASSGTLAFWVFRQ